MPALKSFSLRVPRDLRQCRKCFVRVKASVAFCRPAARKWTRVVSQRNIFPGINGAPVLVRPSFFGNLSKNACFCVSHEPLCSKINAADGCVVLDTIVEKDDSDSRKIEWHCCLYVGEASLHFLVSEYCRWFSLTKVADD